MDAIDWRGKSESAAISSAINMGETDKNPAAYTGDDAFLCAGCGGKISDRHYLLAVDKQWHTRCLKCCECKLSLASELSCFSKDSSIFCKEDYYRRFSVQRCARCHLGISASEMVMRARDLVYHLNCFVCGTCNTMLTTGDHFGMMDGLVYCRLHFQMKIEAGCHSHFNDEDVAPCNGVPFGAPGMSYYNGVSNVTMQKGKQRRRKNTGTGPDPAAYNTGLTCGETDGLTADRDASLCSSTHKSKRVRTSFKHHQLRAMKSYFAINHNPDAKDLKQLSQKTGLTKRVLQVWFQNARAKFRRNLLRQEMTGADQALDVSMLPGGLPSGPASETSNTSMSPCSTPPATLRDLSTPPLSRVTPTAGGPDLNDSRSPSYDPLSPFHMDFNP